MLMTTLTDSQPAPAMAAAPAPSRRRGHLAMWAVAAAIAALPLLTPQGPANTAPADVFILVALAATLLWAARTRQRLKFPYVAGVGTMVLAGCLAAVFGHYPHAGLLAVVIDIFLLAWSWTVANVGRSAAAAGFLLRAWCVAGSAWGVGFLAFVGRAAAASGVAAADSSRAGFTLGEQNGAALYLGATTLVILAARYPRRLRWRAPVVACLLFDVLLTGSLAGLTGLLAGLAVAVVVRTAARRGAAAALAALIVIGAAGVAAEQALSHGQVLQDAQSSQNSLIRLSIGRAQQSAWERQTLTGETLHLWATSSILGLGPGATKSTLQQDMAPYPKEAHDDWTAAAVERGILGLVGLFALVAEIVARGSAIQSRRLGPDLPAVLPAPEFLIGALAMLADYSFTHEILHDRTVWTLLGFLAAFSLWRRAGARPGSVPAGAAASGDAR